MNYVFVSENARDKIYFTQLIEQENFIPFSVSYKGYESKNEDLNICIDLKKESQKTILDLDYDFILEYYIKRFTLNDVIKSLLPQVTQFYQQFFNQVKEGDLIISANSGEWTSRLLFEICKVKKAKFLFFENFFFSGYYQLSPIPFTNSKFGKPELNLLYKQTKTFTSYESKWLKNYLENRLSKYKQDNLERVDKTYDIFIPGQIPTDTNIVLLNKTYKTSEELCIAIAKKYPEQSIIYKKHPFDTYNQISDEILNLKNVTVSNANVVDIIEKTKKIFTISSTVGIEAMLRNKPVFWFSDTNNSEFELLNDTNKMLFVKTCLNYMFPLELINEKIKIYVSK